jgi:hypothetical protein
VRPKDDEVGRCVFALKQEIAAKSFTDVNIIEQVAWNKSSLLLKNVLQNTAIYNQS